MRAHQLLLVLCYIYFSSSLPTNAGQLLRLQPGRQHEICTGESVLLWCPDATLLPLVRAARYGRMQSHSQCLQRGMKYGNHGSIGCARDVTNYLKRRCLEQKNCSIRLPDDFTGIEPCDDVMYLEIQYDCLEDRTGRPTTYTITTTTGYNQFASTDHAVNIIIFGESGSRLQLLLLNLDRTDFGKGRSDQFVFTNVTSVGPIKCADFQLSGSGQDPVWYLASFSIQSTESASFPVNAYYTTDSVQWPATRGCGTSYTIHLVSSDSPSDSNAWVYITLIGETGNSSQLVLSNGNRMHDRRGYVYNTFSFNNLPPIGKVSCVQIRRDDWRDRSRSYDQYNSEDYASWYLTSIEVRSEFGNSFINVSSWTPSISQLPNGFVACSHGSALCLSDLEASCPMPHFLKQWKSLSMLQLIQKLVEMNMLHFCPAVRNFFNCTSLFLKVNSQCPEDQQLNKTERLKLQMSASLIENVCGSDLDVISCNKECLLQVAEDGELSVSKAVTDECRDHLSADSVTTQHWPPLCQSHEFLNCATNVVAEHCNQAIADVVSKIYGVVSTQFCEETTRPACPYDFTLSEAGCHKLVKSGHGWNVAATECSRLVTGGHLAFIGNETEQIEINKVLYKTSGSECSENTAAYWIGGLRKPRTQFRWYYNASNVANTMCYENWVPHYPIKGDNQQTQCVIIQRTSSHDYKWKHQDCSTYADVSTQTTCSVCEIDI